MKKALTEKDLAALASGMPVDQVAEAPVEDEPKADDAVQAPEAEVEVDAKVEQSVQEDATSAATIKLLAEQLKGAQDDLLNAKVEMSRMQDKINEMNAVVGPLKDIAARAINNMRVALGGSVIDMSAAQPAQVLADHVSVSESFASKFKVGGVASTDANLEAKKDERKVDALTQARLKAVGINR